MIRATTVRARVLFATAFLTCCLAAAEAREPTFRLFDVPGFVGTSLSRDGAVLVGDDHQATHVRTTRVVLSTGEYRILSDIESVADGTNGDGSVVIARRHRWTEPTGWVLLTPLPAGISSMSPYDLSEDGNFIVGKAGSYFATWTARTGAVVINNGSRGPLVGTARATSPDGRVLAGEGTELSYPERYPVRWTDPATGGKGVQWLSELASGRHGGSAEDVNADGSVVVGYCNFVYPYQQAFRWVDPDVGGSGMEPLGILPGAMRSTARAVNDAGDMVTGYSSGPEPTDLRGFVWTPAQGMVPAARWLADRGVPQASQYTITDVNDISPDGRTLVGTLRKAGAITLWTWIATVDSVYCPVDFDQDWVVDFSDYLQFLNFFDAHDPRADLNHDGVIDFGDYLEFLNRFDAGC